MIAEAAGGIGDAQVRNRGTIGGNVVHADPASDWPTVLTALNANFIVEGVRRTRSVSAGDFFQGLFQTNVGEDELLTAIEAPALQANQVAEYAKMAHPATGFAVVGAAVVLTTDGGRCTAASIAVGGLTRRPRCGPVLWKTLW